MAENAENNASENDARFQVLNSLINRGDINNLRAFLDKKTLQANDYKNIKTRTIKAPLCVAAATGNIAIMSLLTSSGFDAETCDFNGGMRPVHYACVYRNLEALKWLVDNHQVDIDSTTSNEDTALFLAVEMTHVDVHVVQYLLDQGADVNYCKPWYLTTALHKAADSTAEVCKSLVAAGANVDAEDLVGYTPLHHAANAGNLEVAEVLLDSGAEVNAPNKLSTTPFIMVIQTENIDLLKLLYSRGADPDVQDEDCSTALHLSMYDDRYEIARYLVVELGVSLDKTNHENETAFGLALIEGNRDSMQLLIDAGFESGSETRNYPDQILKMMLKNEEFIKELRKIATNPRSLQELSCFMIRRLLKRNVSSGVDSLPLPKHLKDIVKLKHVKGGDE